MSEKSKEIIQEGYQPENKEKLKNKDAPKGSKITNQVKPKGDKKEKLK
jgi:hypothetical protein